MSSYSKPQYSSACHQLKMQLHGEYVSHQFMFEVRAEEQPRLQVKQSVQLL